jgi:hypothetical protein
MKQFAHRPFGILRVALLAIATVAVAPSIAHAQRGGHAGHGGGYAAGQSGFIHHHRNGGIWGGYWYPDYYGGYGYGFGYPGFGFGPMFVNPYGFFGGYPSGAFADPYGVFGGPSIFNFIVR